MPRAAEYRHAARVLTGRSAALADAASAHRRHRIGEFGEGPIAVAHDEAISTIAARLDLAGSELAGLADLCRRRADVCDEYSEAMRRWSSLDVWERLATPPPQRPAAWADA